MTVRKEKRRDPKSGRVREFWFVDADVELPDGRRKRVRKVSPIQTRRGAEEHERQIRRAILDGSLEREEQEAKVNKKPVPTIEDFVDVFVEGHCRAERLKPSTVASNRQVLRHNVVPRIGKKRLDEVTNADVQKLKSELVGLAPKTVNNTLTALNVMLKKAVEWGAIDVMPCTIKLLKVHHEEMEFYDDDDLNRLLVAAAVVDARLHLAMLLAADAGLRMGEVAALEWGRVAFARNMLVIAASEWRGELTTTKGGKVREVQMTTRLAAALKAHGKLRSLTTDRAITLDSGRAYHRDAFRKGIMRVERRAGLAVTGRFHIFRHTFCARLAMRGAPAKSIQELAGHADLMTTMRYMHLTPAARAQAIGLLEDGANGNLTATKQAEEGA